MLIIMIIMRDHKYENDCQGGAGAAEEQLKVEKTKIARNRWD